MLAVIVNHSNVNNQTLIGYLREGIEACPETRFQVMSEDSLEIEHHLVVPFMLSLYCLTIQYLPI